MQNPPIAYTINYHWLHVPSGKTGMQLARKVSSIPEINTYHIKDSNELLNRWNRNSEWKFWADEVDHVRFM